jgi:hypothetical protein
MKKTDNDAIRDDATIRELAKQLWNEDGQPIVRNLDFFREIEDRFFADSNFYHGNNLNALHSHADK